MLTKTNNRIMLDDKAYSVGKKLAQIYIPAFSTLYFTLSGIWGLPATTQVIGTLAALATFIGVCLGLSSVQYDASGAAHDGQLVVSDTEEGNKLFSLELNGDPVAMADKKSVSFKVTPKE